VLIKQELISPSQEASPTLKEFVSINGTLPSFDAFDARDANGGWTTVQKKKNA